MAKGYVRDGFVIEYLQTTIMVPWLKSDCKHLLDVFSHKL
jgi:hypothetical protein